MQLVHLITFGLDVSKTHLQNFVLIDFMLQNHVGRESVPMRGPSKIVLENKFICLRNTQCV